MTGIGSLGQLDSVIASFGSRDVAVVADGALQAAGVLERVTKNPQGWRIASLELIEPDPDIKALERAVAVARSAGAGCLLAVGGGSALGVGKAVGIRLTNDQLIDAYEGRNRIANLPAPTVAVPTTAGSGSEVSNALVLHEKGRENEIVVRGDGCEPRAAILDATLLRTNPCEPLVHSALDALSHAMEALWARGASYITTEISTAAARSIIDCLPAASAGVAPGSNRSGENDAVLQELFEASCAANMACGNSGLALLHALSSSPAIPVPHGLQNAVLLAHVARFNENHLVSRTAALISLIQALYDDLDLDPSFGAIGVGTIDGQRMIEASAQSPFRANNIRASSDEELTELLTRAGAAFGLERQMT